MARRPKEKSPHRLRHEESSLLRPVDISTMGMGDVFVRQGSPCMIVDPRAGPGEMTLDAKLETKVWICNLQTGSVWPVSPVEQIFPATDVVLKFHCARRD